MSQQLLLTKLTEMIGSEKLLTDLSVTDSSEIFKIIEQLEVK